MKLNYICKICNRPFASERGLKIHIGQIEKLDKLSYLIKYCNFDPICPICNLRKLTVDKVGRLSKTCGDPCCVSRAKDISSIKNNGKTASEIGAIKSLEKWNSLNEEDKSKQILKTKETIFARYGVYAPLKVPGSLEKYKNTSNVRYGVDNYAKTEEHRQNISTLWKDESYKDKSVEKLKKTIFEKYGYDNISKVPEIIKQKIDKFNKKSADEKLAIVKKCQETQRSNNNGLLWCQTHLAHKRHNNKLKYDNYTFDSKPELLVYKFCKENGLNFEYQPKDAMILFLDDSGKVHRYHPDFRINGKLFEVKGRHFFNKKGILYCPFARNLPDIEYRDRIAELKHESMIANNVTILINGNLDTLKESLNICQK